MCAIELNIPYSRVYSSYNIFKSQPPEMAKKIIWKTSAMSKKEAGKSRSITWIILKCLRRGIRLPSDMFVAPGED